MAITRRSFLAGLGSVSVGLLFRRKLDAVLESLERDQLSDEPSAPDQLPSAAEIVVCPQATFLPQRLVVAAAIAPVFVIEDIRIGAVSQVVHDAAISAEIFTANAANALLRLDVAPVGTEIRFRVRYVGSDPAGARFTAALIGRGIDGGGTLVLPVDSGGPIVS